LTNERSKAIVNRGTEQVELDKSRGTTGRRGKR